MKKAQKFIAISIVSLLFLNAGSVFAADSAATLLSGIKTLQASIDSGTTKPASAIDEFAKTIVEQNISVNDVNAFVKTQMTPAQFAKFQDKMNSSLRGIDPATLSSSEMGEIVGQSLADIHTEGLYWSGCANVWTGAAIITAAIVAGSIAIVKSKSISAIQSDYNNRISNTISSDNQAIADTNNWKTAFPQRISDLNNQIRSDQSDISYLQSELNTAEQQGDSAQVTIYQNEISADYSEINSDENAISDYSSKMVEYAANPSQVAVDAAAIAAQRDSTVANLHVQENNAVAAAPSNQKLGQQLFIGAGIGAAIGTGLLIYGFKEGACGY